jgi:hypothetical protein
MGNPDRSIEQRCQEGTVLNQILDRMLEGIVTLRDGVSCPQADVQHIHGRDLTDRRFADPREHVALDALR